MINYTAQFEQNLWSGGVWHRGLGWRAKQWAGLDMNVVMRGLILNIISDGNHNTTINKSTHAEPHSQTDFLKAYVTCYKSRIGIAESRITEC